MFLVTGLSFPKVLLVVKRNDNDSGSDLYTGVRHAGETREGWDTEVCPGSWLQCCANLTQISYLKEGTSVEKVPPADLAVRHFPN